MDYVVRAVFKGYIVFESEPMSLMAAESFAKRLRKCKHDGLWDQVSVYENLA
jgi:hypothetical protein